MEDSVKKNPDLFSLDSMGRTSLFHPAETGNIEEVQRIIFSLTGTGLSCQRLSLIKIRDSSGSTAGDVALKTGHKDIADLLQSEQTRMEFFE